MHDSKHENYAIVESLTESQIQQLHQLIVAQWWGKKRTLDEVHQMVKNTSLLVGLVDTASEKLLGHARVLTDFVFRATVYDVIVADEIRGRGFGKRLMDSICSHSRIQHVSHIYLCCEEQNYSFYEKWGFKKYAGRAQWMVKIQRGG